ncbi:hypothetical protein ACMU_08910 [Actibacterium mucosum KCTC 23349]|uniref:Type II secretion system protein GspF domain-containing protein n=1 Tax=Actibacterium mucosum KCTC 23349 TaxID=1454373 RepID=A0A037ZIF4_9RHOB|nr:type II secretion system F family protein [Actibacterium mucosum]KAJ55878.1 hypothetical protein ACMU_08910 [Actibacterium mucosum KCTC 23349]
MTSIDPNLLYSGAIFVVVFALGLAVLHAGLAFFEAQLSAADRAGLGQTPGSDQANWNDEAWRMAFFYRLAPRSLTAPEGMAAEFDDLFWSGGRPVGALTGDQFLVGCMMMTIMSAIVLTITFAVASFIVPVSPLFALGTIIVVPLLIGFNQMTLIRRKAKEHMADVVREIPYFLDLLVLVLQAGGNFRTAIETYIQSVPSGAMRREAQMIRQQLSLQGDAASLMQLAERIPDQAIEQVIGTIAKGIETGGDPTKDAEQAERLRLIRQENANALAKSISTKMNLITFVALGAVFLSIFATVYPMISAFG